MIKFYFVRHGQTVSNIYHKLQGWSDTPLTSLGILQGKEAQQRLLTTPFIAAYSSPSKRALQTARYICEDRSLDIISLNGLKELSFGSMEGKEEDINGLETSVERILFDWQKYGGENIDDVTSRVRNTLYELVTKHKYENGNILCVAHGFSILAAIRAVDKDIFDDCLKNDNFIGNCAISIIEWNSGKFYVRSINQ